MKTLNLTGQTSVTNSPLGLGGFEAISGICLNLICTDQEARKASLSQAATQGHEL